MAATNAFRPNVKPLRDGLILGKQPVTTPIQNVATYSAPAVKPLHTNAINTHITVQNPQTSAADFCVPNLSSITPEIKLSGIPSMVPTESVDTAAATSNPAEPQMLISRRDASDFRAASDSVISVDGMAIRINAGDSVYAVAAKINDSGAAVKASIDPESHGINLQTTDARQLWLEDVSGSVLSDLGIVKDASQRPPYNTGDSVRVTGGSLFDSVIALRDAMYRGDSEAIGGRVLGSLDSGINNLTTRLAENGALYERAQANIERNAVSALNANKLVSREGDLDFTKAVTDMKMMEYVQQATLSTAGRLYSSTLLDYIK